MYIYKTTNKINGKIYVGLSKYSPEENPNYLGSGYILKKAIKKYGEKNFKKEILEECKSKKTLLKRERYWISLLESQHRKIGYNICEGGTWGDNWKGCRNKAELRRRFSKMVKGKKNPNYGNRWTKEQRDAASNRNKANKSWISKKTGKNIAQSRSARKKISETKLGLKNPQAKLWKLISPEGKEFQIRGGIKRKIKRFGLDYQSFIKRCVTSIAIDDHTRQNRQGWKLIEMEKARKA